MYIYIYIYIYHTYSQGQKAVSQNVQKKEMQNPVESMLQYTYSRKRTHAVRGHTHTPLRTHTWWDTIYSKGTEYIVKVLNI